jgi:hypothetical protein
MNMEKKSKIKEAEQNIVVSEDSPDVVVSKEPAVANTVAAPAPSRELADMSGEEFLKFLDEGSAEELLELVKVDTKPEPAAAKLPWFREMVSVPEGKRNAPTIFMWWEGRRPLFNALVAICGLPFALALMFMHLMPVFGVILGVAGYGLTANLCYTLGPAAEIVVAKLFGVERAKRMAPELLVLGLVFSMLVTVGGGMLTFFLLLAPGPM